MNTRHTDARSWDVDLSTRQSVHPITRYTPISGTASTTAADLLTIDRNDAQVNMVLNPSIEGTDIGEYTASGSAISRVSTQADTGTYSLQIDPTNAAANEGFYYDIPSTGYSNDTQFITAQCTVRGASASGTFKIEILPAGGTPGTGALATSATHTLTTSFVNVNVQYGIPGGTSDTGYRIAFVSQAHHNINMFVDKTQRVFICLFICFYMFIWFICVDKLFLGVLFVFIFCFLICCLHCLYVFYMFAICFNRFLYDLYMFLYVFDLFFM